MQSAKIDLLRDKFHLRRLFIIILLLRFTRLRNSVAFKCELSCDFDILRCFTTICKIIVSTITSLSLRNRGRRLRHEDARRNHE